MLEERRQEHVVDDVLGKQVRVDVEVAVLVAERLHVPEGLALFLARVQLLLLVRQRLQQHVRHAAIPDQDRVANALRADVVDERVVLQRLEQARRDQLPHGVQHLLRGAARRAEARQRLQTEHRRVHDGAIGFVGDHQAQADLQKVDETAAVHANLQQPLVLQEQLERLHHSQAHLGVRLHGVDVDVVRQRVNELRERRQRLQRVRRGLRRHQANALE